MIFESGKSNRIIITNKT